MRSEYDLIRHSFPDAIDIYPIADVHLGAMEHNSTEWEKFLKRVDRENAYVVIVGDLLNNNTRGVKFANPFDEALRPREAKRKMVEYLEPIRERILCVVTGNHERRTLRDSDQDLTADICCKLDIEHLYRENVAFMAISIGQRATEEKANTTYTFMVTHGSFGGALTGGAVNKNERFAGLVDGLDCFISAHIHRGTATRPAKIVIDPRNNMVTVKPFFVASAEAWLEYGGYAMKGMMMPAETCNPQKLHLVNDKHTKRIIMTW